ncbi:PAS domain S-box protein [Aliinostoc sp. HNIBRCY26]|uniref:PAS domain S-box protein n=1 Tax=Aliinostoc sp. HNIBRCY26 TaxID=3418997 RepID=UPI003D093460
MIRLETAWHSLRYDFLAILFVVLAALLTVALNSLSKYSLFAFFYAAVALSSWCGGTRSGILATLLAFIIFNYFFTPPFYSLALQGVDEIIRLIVFVLVALLIGLLNANLKTARQKLERQVQVLGESETRYRALTENIPQIIWFADADGAIEYLNQRWYDYTGLSSLESLGWKWQQVVHPEDLSFVLQQWTSAVEQRSLLEIESRLQGKDGDYHWHITRAVPVVDGNGVIQRWFGSTTDINEQKQIQQLLYQQEQERSRLLLKLEEKQQRLQAILEQMPAGLIIADISGKLLLGNPQVEQIWRRSFLPAESIEQYQEYQGFHLDGRPYSPHDWPLARSVSTGEVVVNEEINFLRGDGTQGWMLVNSAPIRDSQGEITAGVVTFYDITERKQAQEALQESEERFRQMAESIEDVFWVSTIIQGDYQVLYVSPAYATIWGHPCESLYSNPYGWIESIHPEDQPRVREEFFRRSLHGNTDMEYRIVRPDGSIRWIRDRSFPIPDANGNIYRKVGVAEDITDRKQTEIALKESQALFASFMQHIPGSAYIKDDQGRCLYVNQEGANLLGREIADVIGKTDFDLLSIAVAHKLYECDRAILQNNQPVELHESFPQGDTERHFMTYKFPLIDETGRKMLAGMSFDVTEQKRLEKALKISETKFRRLVDADIIGVVVANSTHIIEANDLFLQMLGYIRADVNNGNLRWRDITPPEYWHLDEQGVVELQTTGKCTPFTKEYIRQDGSRVPILLGATILEESPLTWLCFVLDLTPQQQAEIALRQSEERFRLAAQAVAGIVYDWNLQTGYVYRSEGLYQVMGFHPQEVPQTGTWWSERVHPEDLVKCQEIWLTVSTGQNDRYSAEYRIRHKDGHWVYLWDQGYLIRDQNGNIVRVVGSSADISDRKQVEAERLELLEREKIARTKAEEANRIKDEFLAVLSHELRSPLNPILGWSKLLRSRQLDQATVKNALETIERNAKLQTKLIDDLLDVSRILRGKLTLKTNPVNLVSIIYRCFGNSPLGGRS